jgi:hypothetical protein
MNIASLKQDRRSIDSYLDAAHDLMCEAQDIGQSSLMSLLCSQVVTGLSKEYLQALGDSLLSHIESSLTANSTEDEIMLLFTTIEQRIRARCKQFLHSIREVENADEEKAAMFQAAQEQLPPPPPIHPPQQHQQRGRTPANQKRDRNDDQCHFCGLMGHWKSECPDFRQHQAQQRQQRQA